MHIVSLKSLFDPFGTIQRMSMWDFTWLHIVQHKQGNIIIKIFGDSQVLFVTIMRHFPLMLM